MERLLMALLWVARRLPERLAIGIGLGMGWLMRHVVRFRRRVVTRQLALALPEGGSDPRLLRDHYRHLGLLVMEFLRLPRIDQARANESLHLHGLEHLDAALQRGKGVILFGGHCGNWEICGIAFTRRGYTVKAVGKELKTGVGETLKRLIRDENGVPTIPRRDSIRQIIGALRNNEVLVFMIDQNMTADEGIFVDFFGYPACTTTAVATLAERTGAVLLPAYTYRDDNRRHHHCVIEPPLVLDDLPADKEERLRAITVAASRQLEAMIRHHPSQWLWIHKRWKTRPPGETQPPIRYS